MLLRQGRYLLAMLTVVVLGGVIGWTWRDWGALAGWGHHGALSSPDVSPRIEAGMTAGQFVTMPITPGTWTWQHDDGTSTAVFADALVTVTCDLPAGTVTIARRGNMADGAAVTLLSSTQNRTFQGRKRGEQIAVTLAAGDAFLDALAMSRGRFGVEVVGLDPVYPGSWAEVSRVLEDCRPLAAR